MEEYLEEQRAGPSAAINGTFPVNIIDIALKHDVSYLFFDNHGARLSLQSFTIKYRTMEMPNGEKEFLKMVSLFLNYFLLFHYYCLVFPSTGLCETVCS